MPSRAADEAHRRARVTPAVSLSVGERGPPVPVGGLHSAAQRERPR